MVNRKRTLENVSAGQIQRHLTKVDEIEQHLICTVVVGRQHLLVILWVDARLKLILENKLKLYNYLQNDVFSTFISNVVTNDLDSKNVG